MIKEGKFGVSEAVCFATIAISAKALYTGTQKVYDDLGPPVWMALGIAFLTALVLFTVVYLLLKRFPGNSLTEIFEIVFGRFGGIAVTLIIAIAFLILSSAFLREFTEILKVYVFPNTSTNYLLLFFVACMGIQCLLGLETMARFAKLMGGVLLVSLIALLLLSIKYFRVYNLFPILGHGLGTVIPYGLQRSSEYSEIIVLAVFAGSLQGIRHIKKAGYISVFITAFIFLACGLAYVLMYPYFTASEATSPMYTIARSIEYGKFFQRLDPILLFTWVLSALISTTVQFYTSMSLYCNAFRIHDKKPVLLPFLILSFVIALMPRDFSTVVNQYIIFFRTYGWTIFFGPAILALIVAILRKKRGVENG